MTFLKSSFKLHQHTRKNLSILSALHTTRAKGFPSKVKIVEVGPRDGLQNEPRLVPTDVKVNLINMLADAGLPVVEATAFVSPKWVPQMSDNAQVMDLIKRKQGVTYPVLAPNLKGLDAALKCKVEEIAVFGAASNTFSMKNINCSTEESLQRFLPVVEKAREAGLRIRGYISCALGCPYEGEIDPNAVAKLSETLLDMGCYEICISDTIGVGNPASVLQVIEATKEKVPLNQLAVHFHDTYGQALSNILLSLQQGITVVDSSVAGLGGCPYAKGATGNVATEDVVYMLNGLGIETGVNLDKLLDAADFICSELGRDSSSRAGNALLAQRRAHST